MEYSFRLFWRDANESAVMEQSALILHDSSRSSWKNLG
jgi:hypothetical protein